MKIPIKKRYLMLQNLFVYVILSDTQGRKAEKNSSKMKYSRIYILCIEKCLRRAANKQRGSFKYGR